MDAKITPAHRLDHLDAERFADMLKSPTWSLYERRLQTELDRLRGTCERGDGELEIRRAQGGVAALRAALALPNQMLEQMRAKKTK